jgi:magnesium chelatase subunit D
LSPATFPFSAIAGLDEAKRALLLLAVEPRLKGVLIGGPPGTGKTTLARAFAHLLAECGVDLPAVELPLNITQDRLLGGVDFERSLAAGRHVASRGLLASADRCLLYVDELNLLDIATASLVADALDRQRVILERDGLSDEQPARFVLLGTYDPSEGPVGAGICDRVGIIVNIGSAVAPDGPAEIGRRRIAFDLNPQQFIEEHAHLTKSLRSSISSARALLPRVRISGPDARRLSEAALLLGIPGNRADILADRVARASSALGGRSVVDEEDLVFAIRYVLLPRAKTLQDRDEQPGQVREQTEHRPDAGTSETPGAQSSDGNALAEDLILRALDGAIDVDLPGKTHAYGLPSRRRVYSTSGVSGRQYSAGTHPPATRKIAIAPTIRAAACRQPIRASADAGLSQKKLLLRVKPEDLRYKRFRRRSGPLFIFAVDASGSMAVNRMAQAKGAMLRLLSSAYLNRDKVAMISFRRNEAQVVLEPTGSVELAGRIVDAMPVGGATPLAAGLVRSLELARLVRLRGIRDVALLLFTDGRANVGISDGSLQDELRGIGATLVTEQIVTTVIDTRPRFVPNREAVDLAEWLGAEYVNLPNADPESLERAIRGHSTSQPGVKQ